MPGSVTGHDHSRLIALDRVSRSMYTAATLVGPTWRHHIVDSQALAPCDGNTESVIYCFWHENLLVGFRAFRRSGLTALISPSRDGERLSAVLQRWGYELVRGSSSRQSLTSLRQSLRILRDRRSIVITPDGPRGPRRAMKPGAAQLALATGARVAPVAIHAWPAIRLRSWDRFVVPLPFAFVNVRIGEVVDPRTFASAPDPVRELSAAIERELNA